MLNKFLYCIKIISEIQNDSKLCEQFRKVNIEIYQAPKIIS